MNGGAASMKAGSRVRKRRDTSGDRPHFRVFHPFIVFLLLLISGCYLSYRYSVLQFIDEISKERDRVALGINQVRNNLGRELYATLNLTQGLVAFIQLYGGIDQEQFDAITRDLISRNHLINNVGLAVGYVIRYVYPYTGNEKALGLDYRTTREQIGPVLQCVNEKKPVIAGPVRLVQGGTGIIEHTPIFITGPSDTGTGKNFWGVLSAVVRLETLMLAAGVQSSGTSLYRISLRGIDGTGAAGPVFWGDSAVFSSDPVLTEIALPAGEWQMAAVPLGGWPVFNPLRSPSFNTGSALSLIISILFFFTLKVSRSRRAEINRRKKVEDALHQKNRALRLFSRCTSAVVHSTDEKELLSAVCTIAVESTGYPMAWVGSAENDPMRTVKPVTFAGPGEGVLDRITVSWGDNEFGQGTAGTAIRTRKPCIARDLHNTPTFAVWRDALVSKDIAAAISIPLIVNDAVYGVLLIYAVEADAFDSTEVTLLEELGKDISHGIAALRSRKERDEATAALEQARSELEERVVERTRELLQAKDAAESADRIKSAFLATMSHELRTPLNSIIGFTGIMLQGLVGELSEEQLKQLAMVRDSAHHLLALINDVLDISKIESGQLDLHRCMFDIQDTIDRAVQFVMPTARKKSLSVTLPESPLRLKTFSDQRRVEQILINLLSNAVKFTEAGGITLIADNDRVAGDSQDAEKEKNVSRAFMRISVADTGIGIRSEDLSKLFQPFKQLDTGISRRYEGTGLGLSICKKLALMLGGDIEVSSGGPGTGAVFSLLLPLTEEQNGQNSGDRG